jgi:hypothetical protein
MTKYWQEDPTHYERWGEKGGLPIDSLTINEDDRPRVWQIRKVALLTDSTKKAITDGNGDFILVGEIPILMGGTHGYQTINARERQLERELPDAHPSYNNVTSDVNTANQPSVAAYLAFDGSNWFASTDPNDLLGMTAGYFSQDGFGNIIATTGSDPGALPFAIVGGNVIVTVP